MSSVWCGDSNYLLSGWSPVSLTLLLTALPQRKATLQKWNPGPRESSLQAGSCRAGVGPQGGTVQQTDH